MISILGNPTHSDAASPVFILESISKCFFSCKACALFQCGAQHGTVEIDPHHGSSMSGYLFLARSCFFDNLIGRRKT